MKIVEFRKKKLKIQISESIRRISMSDTPTRSSWPVVSGYVNRLAVWFLGNFVVFSKFPLKNLLLWNYWPELTHIAEACCLGDLDSKLFKWWRHLSFWVKNGEFCKKHKKFNNSESIRRISTSDTPKVSSYPVVLEYTYRLCRCWNFVWILGNFVFFFKNSFKISSPLKLLARIDSYCTGILPRGP